MVRFCRRRFLERLGFVASAPLLHGIAQTLIDEAMGATTTRRCGVFVVIGEAVVLAGNDGILPSGVLHDWTKVDQPMPTTLRPHLAALQPFRNKLALVEGLGLQAGSTAMHGFGYALLSGRQTAGTAERDGGPTGITFDQQMADVIGKDRAVRSILFGLAGRSMRDQSANTFASGAGKPLSHLGRPSQLYARLAGSGSGTSAADAKLAAELRSGLLDRLRGQTNDLGRRLAGPEKIKLDSYLHAIDEYDRKQKLLLVTDGSGCGTYPAAMDGSPEVRLQSMFNMAALALKCGVTNVVGVSISNGSVNEHPQYDFMNGGSVISTYDPHNGDVFPGQIRKVWSFVSELVAGLITTSGVADNLIVTMLAGGSQPGKNAGKGNHHNVLYESTYRMPVVIYDGTGGLRTGGRLVRYVQGDHTLNDVFCTLGHALGAPTDNFGAGSVNRVKGPIADLLA